jgi:hypothetical protein
VTPTVARQEGQRTPSGLEAWASVTVKWNPHDVQRKFSLAMEPSFEVL